MPLGHRPHRPFAWALLLLSACTAAPVATGATAPVAGDSVTFRGDAWADNWFALYSGDRLLAEDQVPITTERSFNAETFTFKATYPLSLAFILKDYKENDSGLEYIGKPNQQMGDGGFIMQLTDLTRNRVVLVSSNAFRCQVIHRAPLNPSCEKDANPLSTCQFRSDPEPAGWKAPAFDDRAWPQATEHTAAAVGPKDGYLQIAWNASAKFIWGPDLKLDNTVLCRATVTAP